MTEAVVMDTIIEREFAEKKKKKNAANGGGNEGRDTAEEMMVSFIVNLKEVHLRCKGG